MGPGDHHQSSRLLGRLDQSAACGEAERERAEDPRDRATHQAVAKLLEHQADGGVLRRRVGEREWRTILAVADYVEASVIVAGAGGLSTMKSALLGRFSHALAQHAH